MLLSDPRIRANQRRKLPRKNLGARPRLKTRQRFAGLVYNAQRILRYAPYDVLHFTSRENTYHRDVRRDGYLRSTHFAQLGLFI